MAEYCLYLILNFFCKTNNKMESTGFKDKNGTEIFVGNKVKFKLKIDLVAEMKMAKMLFEMVLSGGHTHREKEMLARMSNHILDLNIDKAEQLIAKGINTDDTLPF